MTRVWAPRSQQVELLVGNRAIPMRRGPGDWWEAPPGSLAAGQDYWFRLGGPDGKRLPGSGVCSPDDQSRWRFGEFDRGWLPGEYKLVIDTRLEDPCGNRVGEPFEVDEVKPVQKRIESKTVERRFTVR